MKPGGVLVHRFSDSPSIALDTCCRFGTAAQRDPCGRNSEPPRMRELFVNSRREISVEQTLPSNDSKRKCFGRSGRSFGTTEETPGRHFHFLMRPQLGNSSNV